MLHLYDKRLIKKSFFRIGIVYLFLIKSTNLMAQDPTFSQFYNHPMSLNPAFVGMFHDFQAGAIYRNQWFNLKNNFQTYNASVALDIPAFGGLGIIAQGDKEGDGLLQTDEIALLYAYKIIVIPRKLIFQVGFKVNYINQKIQFHRFTFGDQLNEVLGLVTNLSSANLPSVASRGFVDFSNGLVGYCNHYRSRRSNLVRFTSIFGMAFNHITQPEQSLIFQSSKLPFKYSIYYSATIPFGGKSNFMNQYRNKILYIAGIYDMQKIFHQITLGGNVKLFPFYCGVWFRERNLAFSNLDAIIFTSGFETKINNNYNLRLGYAYDFTISHLVASSPGSHEISLSISSIVNYNRNGSLTNSGSNQLSKNKKRRNSKNTRTKCYYFF